MLEFKYLVCVLDEWQCCRKVVSEKSVARGFQLGCSRFLHDSLLMPVLMYSGETMVWRRRSGLALGLYR